MFLVDSLAVLMASYSSRKDKETPIQMRRIIKKKQLKKAYEEYGWNDDQYETGGGLHRNYWLD